MIQPIGAHKLLSCLLAIGLGSNVGQLLLGRHVTGSSLESWAKPGETAWVRLGATGCIKHTNVPVCVAISTGTIPDKFSLLVTSRS